MTSITDNSSWLWTASLLSFFAAIGGLVVLRGLWLEGYSDPESFKDIAEQRRHHKRKGNGIKLVFWGVFIEVVIALGMTFKEAWEAHKTEIAIQSLNPLNRLISEVSAVAFVQLKGTNFLETPITGGPEAAWLTICDNRTNLGGGTRYSSSAPFFSTLGDFSTLGALDFSRINLTINGEQAHGYTFRFQPDILMLGSDFVVTYPPRAIDIIGNVHVLIIHMKFVPHDSEVIGGSAYLTVNGNLRMRFDILPQKTYPPPVGFLADKYNGGFTLIATNGTVAPMPRIDK